MSNTASYELDSSSYLMAIYYKLTGLACGQNHTNPCVKPKITNKKERKNALHNNPIFKYLMLASSESYSSNINYKQLYNTPINKLVDNLFKYIIVTQFNFAKSVVEPWLGINEDGEITQQFQTLYVHDEGINSEDDAIKYAENVFDNWLIEKMHSITWYNYSNQTLD
ncbi:MAG: hypothetical protein IJA72_04480 [Clostridia bacterium]|nr:hypothetical protein [Clostridia bacterium]